jgi:hypothetical protein
MKINIKLKAEKTVQRNLRVPISLNQQMDDTATLAAELGADYHATLIATIQQFNTEFDARLREMKAKGESATSSGTILGSESIPDPVEQPPSLTVNAASTNPRTDTPSVIVANGPDPETT